MRRFEMEDLSSRRGDRNRSPTDQLRCVHHSDVTMHDDKPADLRDSHGDLLPPWLAFPELPRFSIGWRMARPDSHLTDWSQWYLNLDEDERRKYRRRYRAPWPLWTGSYLTLSRSNATIVFGFVTTACVFLMLVSLRFALFPWVRGIKID